MVFAMVLNSDGNLRNVLFFKYQFHRILRISIIENSRAQNHSTTDCFHSQITVTLSSIHETEFRFMKLSTQYTLRTPFSFVL